MVVYVFVFFFFFKQKTAYEMQRGLVGSEMCIRDRFEIFKIEWVVPVCIDFPKDLRHVERGERVVKTAFIEDDTDPVLDLLFMLCKVEPEQFHRTAGFFRDPEHRIYCCCFSGSVFPDKTHDASFRQTK
eukprot:TRINITY_DN12568_c0_g1_i3.p4 TRINITY_DN12568_c0_g1~~TRINITY_DN12568_c0_g1_i3.p4  ORF type:complete len:129 (-),score=31.64 TRINITY_DN12568_c0_g1_i3:477-863(-)